MDLRLIRTIFCFVVGGLAFIGQASAQNCRVFDPELAGAYEGGCKNGLAEGLGKARGLAVYEGEFRAGKKHGRGRKSWPGGDSYEGQFANDMREGEGIYRWGASPWVGDFYWGSYRNDKRHGRGLYSWANGDRFDGEWKEDVRYGQSAMERQRQRAREAWVSSVGGEGGGVCSDRMVGLSHRQEIRGEVIKIDGDKVLVRLARAPSSDKLAVAEHSWLPDALVREDFHEWHPCGGGVD